jgi:hypothetical protein
MSRPFVPDRDPVIGQRIRGLCGIGPKLLPGAVCDGIS